jgi:hypothetical protein
VSKQAAFDLIVNNLRKQGKQSYKEGIGCVYRHPEGLKCAIGHVMPDVLYNENMEEYSLWAEELGSVVDYLKVEYGFDDFDFWDGLQAIHDIPQYKWEDRWKEFAQDHDLVYVAP